MNDSGRIDNLGYEPRGCGLMMAYLIIVALIIVGLCSCKSIQYVEVEKVRTDTTYITKEMRDSIWLHDSIYMHEYVKGDTVFLELTKWHTKYIERLLTDTIYKATHDTIPQPYPVEQKLSKWETTKVAYGGYAMAIVFLVMLYFIVLLVRRFMP